MKNKLIIIGVLFVFIIVSFYIYKKWQHKQMRYSQPKLETIESINESIKQHKLPGYCLIPKDTNKYDFLNRWFGYGTICVFDSNQILLIDNIKRYNGLCYQDIQKKICNKFDFINKTTNPKSKILFQQLINSTNFLNKEDSMCLIRKYKFYIVYGWNKFVGQSMDESEHNFFNCIQSDSNVLTLSVNTDFIDSYCPEKFELPILNL